jgi:hypothetical protein
LWWLDSFTVQPPHHNGIYARAALPPAHLHHLHSIAADLLL